MSAEITLNSGVSAIGAVQAPSGAPPAAASSAGSTALASTASPSLPNPRLTVDPSLNRVVLEFFDSSGTLTNTIPSQKQLEAYRLAAFAGLTATGAGGQGD